MLRLDEKEALGRVMANDDYRITLRLEGSRAVRGMALSDFESFIENFLGALRKFARHKKGAPEGKTGQPEAGVAAATAFKLVEFRTGSGVATIEPITDDDQAEEKLVDAEPIQLTFLGAMLDHFERNEPLPVGAADRLRDAVLSAGEDGRLAISGPFRSSGTIKTVLIDISRIDRTQASLPPKRPEPIAFVSGNLHRVDFEPGKLAIRAPDGVDWVCEFPERLEPVVEALVNKNVWARGSGILKSPRLGKMTIESIESADIGIQGGLFTGEPVPDEELAAAQGIVEPQGLDVFAASEWTDEDEAFLAVLDEE